MTPEELAAIRAKWVRWLEKIEHQVKNLFRSRIIIRRFNDIVQANPALRKRNPFTALVFSNYDRVTALEIRRLLENNERHKNTISLYKLAKGIWSCPNLITRKDYVEMRTRDLSSEDQTAGRDHANADFDAFAGPKGNKVSSEILKAYVNEAIDKTERVRAVADKLVAHYEENEESDLTLGNVDAAVDAVGDLFQRLSLLLKGTQTPPEQGLKRDWDSLYPEWELIFHEPWIRNT